LQQVLKELEQKSIQAEDELSELKSDNETTRINLHLCNQRVKTNLEKIKVLREEMDGLLANQNT
jgi:hypothetical protein